MHVVVDPSRVAGKNPLFKLPRKMQYTSFHHIGVLFDAILNIGMKPMVEVGFMPEALASGKKTVFYYQGNITPPKDFKRWERLIVDFMTFLVQRYGEDEVGSWHFEVWNEPNLPNFWSSDMATYFQLYASTVKIIKTAVPAAQVGGPATAENAWIPELKAYCEQNQIPLDFLSTHQYPHGDGLFDTIELSENRGLLSRIRKTLGQYRTGISKMREAKNYFHFMQSILDRSDVLHEIPRGSLTEGVKQTRGHAGDMPVIYTEWNAGQGFFSPLADELYRPHLSRRRFSIMKGSSRAMPFGLSPICLKS